MEFSKKIKKFEVEAKKIIKAKNIKDILFADNIYEIEVFDPKTKSDHWPFLQLDDKKNILDAFCSCKTQEKEGFCEHLAASYLYVTKNDEPFHIKFKKSFWRALFKIASFQIGFDQKLLKKKKIGSYRFVDKSKLQIFSIEVQKKQIKKLEEILKEKPLDERTSLKYSGISLDEMNLIKEGRASDELKYELSFFSDIAKWFFLMQEDGVEYNVDYKENEKSLDGVFNEIIISFKDVKAKFHVPLNYLEDIIPTLNTVDSSLKLFEYEGQNINKITYDKINVCFHIEKTKGFFEEEAEKKEGIKVGNYIYVKEKGFYPQEPNELLKNEIINKDKISYFLTKYKNIFEEKLQNEKIYTKPIKAKYFLFFDENENLNIQTYLFERFDFEKKYSFFFGPWGYIEDKGFYLLDNLYFESCKTIIKKPIVSQFVTDNRIWLHNFEGFTTHFGSIQAHLIFSLTEKEDLVFSSKLDFPEELGNYIDFEDWIYIRGLGFFSKHEKRIGLPIRPGLVVKKNEISRFIQSHKEELEQIEGFFINEMPIDKIGLNIYLNEEMKITSEPEIKIKEGLDIKKMHFFENFVYIESSGFVEIPKAFNLPERYEGKKVIPIEQEEFFITFELQRLKPYILNLDKRLEKPENLLLKLFNIFKRKRKNKTFFLVDLIYESEIGKVNAIDIYKAISTHKKYIFCDAGLIFLRKTRFNWLKNIKKIKSLEENLIELSTLDIIRLLLLEDVKISESKEAQKTRKLLDELSSFETDKLFDTSLLKSSLRPYQELGIKWLWFLYVNNLSGLLCDEMGLGKTHQSMALIASVHKENPSKYLVVCPTSVIYHWEELLKKFLPSIKVYVYHGISRNIEKFSNFDVLLTSYGILRSEKDNFKKLKFELAIYDEIQIAKNAASLTHRVLKNISANMRLGLTGTPIENYLKELKSIFDIVLPTYLPSESVFKEFFIIPIEKENDLERKKLLKKLINPFILRRRKKDVLKDLPEKIEEIAYADLSEEQMKMYNEIITKSKDTIIQNLKDEKQPVPYVHIFSLLAKLKQVCDHPSLIYKDIDRYEDHSSGKFDLFKELLDEAKESSQKIVVFSQYLNMIEIIENYLKKNSIGYACITGVTKKRFAEIKRFKEDPNCLVFVASLLAAGVGIDLTAGSVVIHYDRWWNPAKENQATDRVHRIGQNRGVQVFKLVSKNTIEERIHTIIEKKQTLIEETIGIDEVDQIKTLSREELIEVLSKIEI